MGIGYQFTDRSSIDYDLWYLDGVKMAMRGPRTVFESTNRFWTFIGAAQTFGRFALRPFPMLVSSWYGVSHLNFGFAGAGPEYFVGHPELIKWINESEICFMQIMSGRSTSTTLLKAVGFGGVLKFTDGPLSQRRFLAADAYRKLLEHYGHAAYERQVYEARESWAAAYRSLIGLIKVPLIAVWVGQEESGSGAKSNDLLGSFPHLITKDEMSVFGELGVEIVRSEAPSNGPQLLLDFVTRRPSLVFDGAQFPTRPAWSRMFNTYYPTPEMHEGVARDIIAYLQCKRSGESLRAGVRSCPEPQPQTNNFIRTQPSPKPLWRSHLGLWARYFRRRGRSKRVDVSVKSGGN